MHASPAHLEDFLGLLQPSWGGPSTAGHGLFKFHVCRKMIGPTPPNTHAHAHRTHTYALEDSQSLKSMTQEKKKRGFRPHCFSSQVHSIKIQPYFLRGKSGD